MADNPLTISFPVDGTTIMVPKGPFNLSVTGKDVSDHSNKIKTATLLLKGVDTNIPAQIAVQPPNWLIIFPINKASFGPKDEYSVEVKDTQDHKAVSKFHMQEAKTVPVGRDAITPGSGETVPGSGFTVSYPYQPNLAVNACIGGPTGWRQYGMQIAQQPNEIFYFQNVAPGSGYTITVTVFDNPPVYSYSNNITVQ